MPRRKELAITERQFEVLSLLWEHGPMTVRELLDHLPREHPLPYTTVLGLLQGMERAGLATHDVENQTHRYRALPSSREATGTLLNDFIGRFFRGSAARLVLGLIDAQQLSVEDLREIETRLADEPVRKSRTVKPSASLKRKQKGRKP